jgi:hypothetical protein
MKRKIIFSLLSFSLFLMTTTSYSQEHNEAKTLLNGTPTINTKELGFFVAPSYALTQMDGSTASLFHLRGGISWKDKYAFGAYFSTSLNQINPQSETVPNVYMDYWSLGGFAEYTLFTKKLVHVTFPLYVGIGEVQMDNEMGEAGLGEASFFTIEPSALLENNLHTYVRFNVGVGYRFVGQMNYRNFDQSDLSGFTGYIGLKFGVFK